jgi:hypothetical protein
LQGIYDYGKESTIQVKASLVDTAFLAYLSGDTLATGTAQNLFQREVVTVSGGTATLSQTPATGTTPYVANLVGTRDFGTQINVVTSAPSANQCSITGKNITFGTGITDGTQVVVFYQYASPSTTTSWSMTANHQVKPISIYGDGIVFDQVSGTFIGTKIRIYQARPVQSFKITLDMKNVTQLDITMDLIPQNVNGNLKLWDFNILT